MRLIERRLIVGEELGALPPGAPVLPLQRDIEDQARRLRLRTSSGGTRAGPRPAAAHRSTRAASSTA